MMIFSISAKDQSTVNTILNKISIILKFIFEKYFLKKIIYFLIFDYIIKNILDFFSLFLIPRRSASKSIISINRVGIIISIKETYMHDATEWVLLVESCNQS
jgi:hypothetical protein